MFTNVSEPDGRDREAAAAAGRSDDRRDERIEIADERDRERRVACTKTEIQ